jgi:hypothetical protein
VHPDKFDLFHLRCQPFLKMGDKKPAPSAAFSVDTGRGLLIVRLASKVFSDRSLPGGSLFLLRGHYFTALSKSVKGFEKFVLNFFSLSHPLVLKELSPVRRAFRSEKRFFRSEHYFLNAVSSSEVFVTQRSDILLAV